MDLPTVLLHKHLHVQISTFQHVRGRAQEFKHPLAGGHTITNVGQGWPGGLNVEIGAVTTGAIGFEKHQGLRLVRQWISIVIVLGSTHTVFHRLRIQVMRKDTEGEECTDSKQDDGGDEKCGAHVGTIETKIQKPLQKNRRTLLGPSNGRNTPPILPDNGTKAY